MDLDRLAHKILEILKRDCKELVSVNLMESPRTIGDAVQEFISDKGLAEALESIGIKSLDNGFSRRAMEDVAFEDNDGNYYAVDVKTHNLQTEFNMPNLISVKRLAKFYKDDKNSFCVLIISYKIKGASIDYKECYFKPIEAFKWDCLTLGALGWGQIQIANANKLHFNEKVCRRDWMLTMCSKLETFYDEEIGKIGERKVWFAKIKEEWESKQ